jgi:hypothetical protein
MSEETKPTIREIEIIKKDTVIKLDLPVDFFFRINQFMLDFTEKPEDMGKIIELITKGEEHTSPQAYHYRTLLSLQLLIEEAAREQGHTEMIHINTTTGEKVSKD